MTKHTKGPWTIDTEWGLIISDLGEVAAIHGVNGTMEATEANARLIAAAPEMLEALKAVFQTRAPCFNFDFESAPDMKLVMAAIAKAEGED